MTSVTSKMPSSKWESDRDEVEVDYQRMDGPQPAKPSIFSGRKGVMLKAMIFSVIFLLGLIIGYALRRNVHETFISPRVCAYRDSYQTYSSDISKELQKYIKLESIKTHLRRYTGSVHLTGTASNSVLRHVIKKQMMSYHLKVSESSYTVNLSYTDWMKPNRVLLMRANGSLAVDATYSGPPRINHPEMTHLYNAFSPSGSAQGKLVYANYGDATDFNQLHAKSVSCKNKIIIMRYGNICSGIKVRNAEKWGAKGVLLFPDPAHVHPSKPPKHTPENWWLPGWAARADSVRPPSFGDPLTPEFPSIDGVWRIPISEANLPSIPVQPIGYDDAQKLMKYAARLDGNSTNGHGQQSATENMTVKLEVNNDMEKRAVTNAFGLIEGDEEPDRYVIVGCHYDAWTFGGVNPNTGSAVMMEIAKALGQMVNKGWKPRRSILFAHWDAGEQGSIGSSEWVEAHSKQLADGTVAYINLAAAVAGNLTLNVEAMPLLHSLIRNVTSMFTSFRGGHETLYSIWSRLMPDPNNREIPHIHYPTWTSDQAAFVHSLGIPTVWPRYTYSIQKGVPQPYPADGTITDTFKMVNQYVDPSFKAHEALTRVVAEMVLQLSTNTRLPFDCRELAAVIQTEYAALKEMFTKTSISGRHLDKQDYLQLAIRNFTAAAKDFQARFNKVETSNILQMRAYNDRLMKLSQAFIQPTGLPGQPQFKNIMFAPSEAGDRDIAFVGIRDSYSKCAQASVCSQDMWNTVKKQISVALVAIESATRSLATDTLN